MKNKLYRKIINKIREEASLLGYGFSIRRIRKGRNDVAGACDTIYKNIGLVITGNPSFEKILFTAFHELRHAEHEVDGLFKNYYSSKCNQMAEYLIGMSPKPKNYTPNPKVGLKAEIDCNKYSLKRLKEYKIEHDEDVSYPMKRVLTYRMFEALKARGEL